jgi:mRNA-degrading endonuclease RelE of RelBE toxin-antitoxin system
MAKKKNLSRPTQLRAYVNDEEKELIERRMQEAKINNVSSYLRKMAIDGYVINVEIKEISETVRLLRFVSNNINQIARHANETGSIYKDDVEEIQKNYKELWQAMREILHQINMITKV